MSDFFTRLAERTLGMEPVARPDLAPVVPSVAEKESAPFLAVENTIPASDRRRDESGSRDGERHLDFLPAQPATDPTMNRREHRDQGAVPSRPEFFVSDQPPQAQVFPTPAKRENAVAAEGNFERSTPAEINSPAIEFPSAGTRHETLLASATPQRLAQGEAPQFERFSPAAPPTIHVSIGRIDVRAVAPAPPRASAAERRPARLSLEQYLRERNEGRR